MGEKEGSSDAAHRAQSVIDTTQLSDANNGVETNEPHQPGGFFSRVIGALSPLDADEPVSSDDVPHPRNRGMVNLHRMSVEDVAVPKADINAVPDTVSLDELIKVFQETGQTRLPVFEGTLDTPIGFAHLKDIALHYGFNGRSKKFDLRECLRPLLFVPPSMTIGVLLTKMQTERRHMALVIDEYGGVDGLVTIEDLIEQVVGEIEDEHDVDEGIFFTREKPGCYLAFAKTPLTDFEEEIGISLTTHDDVDEEEIDTLGGLVFMLAGRVPTRGEVVAHPDGPDFEVIDADPRRIKRLRVRLNGSEPAE